MARQSLLFASAALLSGAHGQADEFVLAGACDHKTHLDGLAFIKQGVTYDGAPWYKAVGQEEYIYWDPDCAGGHDGTPRWVMDSDRPNEEAWNDLDGDGRCEYHARLNSGDKKHPPAAGMWFMECTGGWREQFMILAATPSVDGPISTVTKTTTRAVPTDAGATSTTRVPTTRPMGEDDEIDPETDLAGLTRTPCPPSSTTRTGTEHLAPQAVVLTGACDMKCNLNNLVFVLAGRTADGAPYYKASGQEQYLYRDADGATYCDGRSANALARWVLDQDRPVLPGSAGVADEESRCDYHAHVDSPTGGAERPPAEANWRMYCGAALGWQDVAVTLQEVRSTTPATVFVSGAPSGGLLPFLVLPLLALAAK